MRDLPRIEVVLLFLAGAVAGAGVSLLFSADNRTVGATLLGGVVVAIGTFRTIQVAREGQITDRFAKAIEEIGDDKPDVRLGGIYALERIARDSRRDHGPVMEVLTAYVRNRAPWPPKQERRFANRPENDVQAALAVLARRNVSRDEHELDLNSTDLRGALFGHDANLARWMLRNAHLEGAKLQPAKGLEKADLAGASYDVETEWPDRHDPEARGAQRVAGGVGE